MMKYSVKLRIAHPPLVLKVTWNKSPKTVALDVHLVKEES